MRIVQSSGTFKKLRSWPRTFQATFRTPLDDLSRFVSVVVSSFHDHRMSMVELVQVVFEPYGLDRLAKKYPIAPPWRNGVSIEAEGISETQELLEALLSEWIDFALISAPNRISIYADHDEYITFFANRKSVLGPLTALLADAGFGPVEYHRKF